MQKSMFRKFSLSFTLLLTLLFFPGCGKDSSKNIKIPGVRGPTLSLIEDNVLLSVVFEKLHLPFGGRFSIPQYPNSYIELSPDIQSDGTLFAVSISIEDLLNDELRRLDPQTLPGGRALPGILSGRLPAVAFTIEELRNISFYMGQDIFGLFIPINIGWQLPNEVNCFRFHIGEKRAGNICVVLNDQHGENGGLLLMLDLNSQIKKKLKKIAKRYR